MNLNQLKYFYAVCTFQSVSAAAEYLYVSQPSLSSAIKMLENEFGVALFRRHHQGMALTAEGEMLLKLCEDFLNRADQIENIMTDLGKKRKKLRLGIPPMIGLMLLPQIYGNFHEENPDIKLEIIEGGRHELMQQLSGDFLDMAILPHNQTIEPWLSAQYVSKLEIVCCVSKDNPISKYTHLCAKDLLKTPLVLFEDRFFQTENIKKWFVLQGINPNILLQTGQLSTVKNIISSNLAAGFMFKELVDRDADFVPIPLNPPMHTDISLIWKKDAYPFSAMNKFKEFISSMDNN